MITHEDRSKFLKAFLGLRPDKQQSFCIILNETVLKLKLSSGINSLNGQAMVVALRRYGLISRELYSRVSKVLYHIKY
jgi:hypothetical protein